MTSAVCSSNSLRQNWAVDGHLVYSLHRTFMSPDIGHEKRSRQSKDLRTRLSILVYDTLKHIKDMSKCLPRIAMFAREKSASESKTMSSSKIRTLRVLPCCFRAYCCSSSLSTSFWFHLLKTSWGSKCSSIVF